MAALRISAHRISAPRIAAHRMAAHRMVALCIAALCIAAHLATGCYSVDALPRAKDVVHLYLDDLSARDLDAALALYHPTFFDGTPREAWRARLVTQREQLGVPKEYKLQSRKVFYGAKEAGAGTYVRLGYSIRYSRAVTEETFILYHDSEAAPPSITRHQLVSTRLDDRG
jgi:hypothetical protein